MGDRKTDVVVTGVGVCCNMGDDLGEILGRLRSGKNIPFERWEVAVDLAARCQVIGRYHGDVSDTALGVGKKLSRFMGRGSRLALKSALAATQQAGLFEGTLPHLARR